MAPKKIASITFYEDNTFKHNLETKPPTHEPTDIKILKKPEPDDLYDKVLKGEIRSDSGRREWLQSGGPKKISIRVNNLKERTHKHGWMPKSEEWCTKCHDLLLQWFRDAPGSHAAVLALPAPPVIPSICDRVDAEEENNHDDPDDGEDEADAEEDTDENSSDSSDSSSSSSASKQTLKTRLLQLQENYDAEKRMREKIEREFEALDDVMEEYKHKYNTIKRKYEGSDSD